MFPNPPDPPEDRPQKQGWDKEPRLMSEEEQAEEQLGWEKHRHAQKTQLDRMSRSPIYRKGPST